jgi:hypothetical protein
MIIVRERPAGGRPKPLNQEKRGRRALSVRDAGHRWWGEKAIGTGGKVE